MLEGEERPNLPLQTDQTSRGGFGQRFKVECYPLHDPDSRLLVRIQMNRLARRLAEEEMGQLMAQRGDRPRWIAFVPIKESHSEFWAVVTG